MAPTSLAYFQLAKEKLGVDADVATRKIGTAGNPLLNGGIVGA